MDKFTGVPNLDPFMQKSTTDLCAQAYSEFTLANTNVQSEQHERLQKSEQLMQGMRSLSLGFAMAMREANMPTDTVQRVTVDGQKQVVPVWWVVQDYNLSNKQTGSIILLTDLPSMFKQKIDAITPKELGDIIRNDKIGSYDFITINSDEIAVTGMGELVQCQGSAVMSKYGTFIANEKTIVAGKPDPKTLFSINGDINAGALFDAMKSRLRTAQQTYAAKLANQQEAGQVVRDVMYYEAKDLPVVELGRGWLSRLLRRK